MDPMPSGAGTDEGEERADAAAMGTRGAAQLGGLAAVAAVGAAGGRAAGPARDRARPRAQTTMHAAAAIAHGRLAAAALMPRAGAAPGCRQEITGAIAVLQPAAAVQGQHDGDRFRRARRIRTIKTVRSGNTSSRLQIDHNNLPDKGRMFDICSKVARRCGFVKTQ
jgi:hypothetical protein